MYDITKILFYFHRNVNILITLNKISLFAAYIATQKMVSFPYQRYIYIFLPHMALMLFLLKDKIRKKTDHTDCTKEASVCIYFKEELGLKRLDFSYFSLYIVRSLSKIKWVTLLLLIVLLFSQTLNIENIFLTLKAYQNMLKNQNLSLQLLLEISILYLNMKNSIFM